MAPQQSAGPRVWLYHDLFSGIAGYGPHQPAAPAGGPRLLPPHVDVLAVHGARWSIRTGLQLALSTSCCVFCRTLSWSGPATAVATSSWAQGFRYSVCGSDEVKAQPRKISFQTSGCNSGAHCAEPVRAPAFLGERWPPLRRLLPAGHPVPIPHGAVRRCAAAYPWPQT